MQHSVSFIIHSMWIKPASKCALSCNIMLLSCDDSTNNPTLYLFMASLNTALFSTMIKEKRGDKGLRETAKEIGQVSATTLSRLENEHLPDIETYMRVCNWLNVPSDFFQESDNTLHNTSQKKTIIAHLRAEKLLPKKNAAALINMIELAYAELEKQFPIEKKAD